MKLFPFIFSAIFLASASSLSAKHDAYTSYIEEYSPIAIEQMQAYGIPASITLAQGILESRAGQSSLAVMGNNHFGIKCHNEWTGDTLLRNDDLANECFRSYPTALQSFEDHSKFLLRKRYKPLFDHRVTDYASWAHGLKACGYATDPNYAVRLISIIERYSLYQFDTDDSGETEMIADFIHQTLKALHPVRKSRGLHCVIASPGDTYSSVAKELGMDLQKLLMLNDAEEDMQIKPWEEIYLEPKLDSAPQSVSRITIGDGESIHSIAQRFGMKMEAIKRLNPKVPDCPGQVLRLR